MDLIERFKYVMKLNGLTASAFALKIGVQPSSVSHVISGRNKPSLEFIQKILSAFPKIDPNWLINGSTKTPSIQELNNPKVENIIQQVINDEELVNVPAKTNLIVDSINPSTKSIQKIVVFYTDGTFEELKA